MASYSSCKYDVFLSFRGKDTRYNFISHLHSALCREKIKTFIDETLKRGNEISPSISNAIEGSKISVIVFSKNYASSKWCLDELVKIFECKNMNGQMVIPIFYHVDPSDVRKQTGSFKKAFIKHDKQFKEIPHKVRKWRAILTKASNVSGWTTKELRYESQLVDEIIKDILKRLKDVTVSTDSGGLVGLHSRIEQIKSLLCGELSDFRIIGIWGMGGIGKTTIAGAIFNLISREFEGRCYMTNVREESEKAGGLMHLREQILSEILKENVKVRTPDLPEYIRVRLRRMKVFIILDDVNKVRQLEYFTGGLDRFGPGSRIIITTRDKRVLDNFGVHNSNIYEVNGLDYHEALQLFCNFAFKQNHLPGDLLVLSKRVVEYANGNPLALRMLGYFLHQKSKLDWENTLENLNLIPDLDIYELLKISYNELKPEEKSVFLDIACFFAGEDKDFVKNILEVSNYLLNELIDKSLISISCTNKLQMHDLLQEMGRKIIRQESIKDPSKRSRLWYHEDVSRVLRKNKGTSAIEGIFLDLSKITRDIYLDSRAFEKMPNLRLLKFYVPEYYTAPALSFKVYLNQGLEYLPEELRYFHWHEYPLKTLPSNLDPENLIALTLPYSKVEQVWEGEKEALMLKYIDLHHSQHLIKFPEPSEIKNIMKLKLSKTAIEEVPSSIECLPLLTELHLSYCTRLKRLPTSIAKLKSLFKLNLHGNRGLVSLLPLLSSLSTLVWLNLSDCGLMEISQDICHLSSLVHLNLSENNLKNLPASIGCLFSLESLNPHGNDLESLPTSIGCLSSLESLYLNGNNLESLPTSIGCLSLLESLYLSGNNLKNIPPSIGRLSSLESLDLRENELEGLPVTIKKLSKLQYLDLRNCNKLKSISELPLSLICFYASNCKQLQASPKALSCPDELDTSILKKLSVRSYLPMKVNLNFTDYLKQNEKADNFLEDSQQTFQYMAVASLRPVLKEEFEDLIQCTLHLPGSKISDWISNRFLFNSIAIKLPLHCGHRFIGFAACVVIRGLKACNLDFSVDCNCHFKIITPSETKHIRKKCTFFVDSVVFFDSIHFLLGFCPCWNVGLPDGDHHTTVSFQFSVECHHVDGYLAPDHELRCGLRPVYLNANETKPNNWTLKFAADSEGECTSGASASVGISDEE